MLNLCTLCKLLKKYSATVPPEAYTSAPVNNIDMHIKSFKKLATCFFRSEHSV